MSEIPEKAFYAGFEVEVAMPKHVASVAELEEVKKDISRALVEISRGARVIQGGDDVTQAQRLHLQNVVAVINAELNKREDAKLDQNTQPPTFSVQLNFARLSERLRGPWRSPMDWPIRGLQEQKR